MLRSAAQVRGFLRQLPTIDSLRCISSSQTVSAAFGSTLPSPTKLEAIVNMEKMLQRTPEQIGTLWQEVSRAPCSCNCDMKTLLSQSPAIAFNAASCQRSECSSFGKQRMESILNKGQSMVVYLFLDALLLPLSLRFSTFVRCSPYFVIPLRKPQGGYLTVVLQHQLPLIIFTTLEEFRR